MRTARRRMATQQRARFRGGVRQELAAGIVRSSFGFAPKREKPASEAVGELAEGCRAPGVPGRLENAPAGFLTSATWVGTLVPLRSARLSNKINVARRAFSARKQVRWWRTGLAPR